METEKLKPGLVHKKNYYKGEIPPPNFIHIGNNNYISADMVCMVLEMKGRSATAMREAAERHGLLCDARRGGRNGSYIVLTDGHVVISSFSPKNVATRLNLGILGPEISEEPVVVEERPMAEVPEGVYMFDNDDGDGENDV